MINPNQEPDEIDKLRQQAQPEIMPERQMTPNERNMRISLRGSAEPVQQYQERTVNAQSGRDIVLSMLGSSSHSGSMQDFFIGSNKRPMDNKAMVQELGFKPRKDMPLKEFLFKSKGNMTARLTDHDHDGVISGMDCFPFDSSRHGVFTKGLNFLRGRGFKEDSEIQAEQDGFRALIEEEESGEPYQQKSSAETKTKQAYEKAKTKLEELRLREKQMQIARRKAAIRKFQSQRKRAYNQNIFYSMFGTPEPRQHLTQKARPKMQNVAKELSFNSSSLSEFMIGSSSKKKKKNNKLVFL